MKIDLTTPKQVNPEIKQIIQIVVNLLNEEQKNALSVEIDGQKISFEQSLHILWGNFKPINSIEKTYFLIHVFFKLNHSIIETLNKNENKQISDDMAFLGKWDNFVHSLTTIVQLKIEEPDFKN